MSKIYTALGYPSIGQPIVKPMKPPKFPMKFKEFLRRMFGGRLHADRLRSYRRYLFEKCELEIFNQDTQRVHSPESRNAAAEKMRDDLIAKYSHEGIIDIRWYIAAEEAIKRWKHHIRLRQRRDANKSRWDKEKRKKILELPKTNESGVSQGDKCSLASPKGKKGAGSHPKK